MGKGWVGASWAQKHPTEAENGGFLSDAVPFCRPKGLKAEAITPKMQIWGGVNRGRTVIAVQLLRLCGCVYLGSLDDPASECMATIAREIAIPMKASAIKHVCIGKTLLARFSYPAHI
ncbi:MAG TPA: hypothetical protein VGG26_07770 [Terracidiphilus sp.]